MSIWRWAGRGNARPAGAYRYLAPRSARARWARIENSTSGDDGDDERDHADGLGIQLKRPGITTASASKAPNSSAASSAPM